MPEQIKHRFNNRTESYPHIIYFAVSFPQLEELISPHMCRSKPRINEEKQIGEVFYISGRFCPYDLHSRYKNT